jgi:hypothetical protein
VISLVEHNMKKKKQPKRFTKNGKPMQKQPLKNKKPDGTLKNDYSGY